MYKLKTTNWHILRTIFLLAGTFSFILLILFIITNNFIFVVLLFLIAIMQIIFAITGYCPSAILLDKIGFPRE